METITLATTMKTASSRKKNIDLATKQTISELKPLEPKKEAFFSF